MRALILAAALLAAAPADAFEERYHLAPGNSTSHGRAWTLSYHIGRREAALAHCQNVVRGPRYGDLERAIDRTTGIDRAAVRIRIAEQIKKQVASPLTVGGLTGLMGYELAERPAPLDQSRMSTHAMVCHGLIPESVNLKRDDDFCKMLMKAR